MNNVSAQEIQEPVYRLTKAFLLNFPVDAARHLEKLPAREAIEALREQPSYILAQVFERLAPGSAISLLQLLPDEPLASLLENLDLQTCACLISQLEDATRERILALTEKNFANELRSLLQFPQDSAGRLMDPRVVAFNKDLTVEAAIQQMKMQKVASLHHLFLLTDDMKLCGCVDIHRIALADGHESLSSLSIPAIPVVQALDHKDDVVEKLEKYRVDAIPVVDLNDKLLGVIEGPSLIDALKENISTDMMTMVGASKDERALSSSIFAVKKRLPWLQINLLTAFLAAAVVGAFEATITKYTALAILLPIAAGQSGNAGAQALAVTMRGLTLREITMRHWMQVMLKEFGTGLLNGIGIAITCSAGIYLWSQSVGLALIMALSMIISMTIAGVSGALVPILLKRFGLDPAQSSSIVLTTVTDIAGFMSFLGIATLLSNLLDAG